MSELTRWLIVDIAMFTAGVSGMGLIVMLGIWLTRSDEEGNGG